MRKNFCKKFNIFILVCLCWFNCFIFFGCSSQNSNYNFDIPETSEEAFAYQIIDDEVYIIGLTQFGKDLKDIHIPAQIEGKNVVGLRNTENLSQPDLFDFSYKDKSSFSCKVNTIILPSTIRTISQYFFTKTTANAIKINGELQVVPSYAFRKANIKEVFISEGVVEIGEGAFAISSVERVFFPKSLKTIQNSAFINCDELKHINFSEGLETIGRSAFQGCTEIEKLQFPNSLKSIGSFSFCPHTAGDSMDIETIIFGENVESIGESAFSSCKKLRTVELKNVKTIESGAFYYCSKLRTVVIGENIEWINIRAFENCRSVSIYCYADSPPCGNLYNVSNYYVLEKNYKNWVNSGQVDSVDVKTFDPETTNFNAKSDSSLSPIDYMLMIFGIGTLLAIIDIVIKKYVSKANKF